MIKKSRAEETPEEKDIRIRKSGHDHFALLLCMGMIGWITTDFFGGMLLFLFAYYFFVLPLIVCYVVSFFRTINTWSIKGFQYTKFRVYSHLSVFAYILIISLTTSEMFKSKIVLSANHPDDRYNYNLVFRENGSCEMNINGIFGFFEKIDGEYHFSGDTIIFTKVPYDNNWIPDRVLVDKYQNAIFFTSDTNGCFVREKGWMKSFDIVPEEE